MKMLRIQKFSAFLLSDFHCFTCMASGASQGGGIIYKCRQGSTDDVGDKYFRGNFMQMMPVTDRRERKVSQAK